MAFVKVVKTNAYYKRFQVPRRRRYQGKTDYYARRRLIQQDKNKYDTKKYRLVVRRTNRKIICQIIYSTIQGDRVLCQALSTELKKFGVEAGLTNYAACYATGLLVARRLLSELGLQDMYKGVENVDGEVFDVYEKNQLGEKRPFKAVLDVGLVRTTTGNRVFGALKGAVDGGIFIPHNNKRFPGYHVIKAQAVTGKKGKVVEKGKKSGEFNAKEHREHIFGQHVQKYMDLLKKDNKERYTKLFSKWDECLKKNKASNLEALYKKLHSDIRKSPKKEKAADKKQEPVRKVVSKDKWAVVREDSKKRKYIRHLKLSNEERKKRVLIKIKKAINKK